MFGLSFGEIFIIMVIAIVFLGPEKLPGAIKGFAKTIKDIRLGLYQLKRSITEDEELKNLRDELIEEDLIEEDELPSNTKENKK